MLRLKFWYTVGEEGGILMVKIRDDIIDGLQIKWYEYVQVYDVTHFRRVKQTLRGGCFVNRGFPEQQ